MHKALIPDAAIHDRFFDDGFAEAVLEFALGHQSDFQPSHVSADDGRVGVDPQRRQSLAFSGSLAGLRDRFIGKVRPHLDPLFSQCGITPIEEPDFELELAAHGDGAFYGRHEDVFAAGSRRASDRVLSIVYYAHSRPKAFTGGELVLHDMRGSDACYTIEPLNDRLVAFPSIAPHEIAPVSLPGDRFADCRFALSFWVRR